MKNRLLHLLLSLLLPSALLAERPNIVFLLADDQRHDTMGVTGNEILKTPEMDRLANDGALFENSFVVSSACAPNRAAILSGMYNRTTGVRDFSADFTPEQRKELYPFVLKRAGYHIGFIGKWGVASTIKSTIEPYKAKFDYWRGFVGQGHFYTKNRQDRHLTQVMADQAEEFFQTAPRDRPFCLSVSFKAPHGPWNQFDRRFADYLADEPMPVPPTLTEEAVAVLPGFMRTYRLSLNGQSIAQMQGFHDEFVRQYYRLIAGLDEAVGRIRSALKAQGLADNTIIVYGSDNGHFLHEWGFHGKWLMYEPSIRVPLIIFDPRVPKSDRGKRIEEIVLSIDYAPTFLDWAGAPIPAEMQGRSLAPLVDGETPADWRDDFFYDYAFEMFPGDIPKSIGVRTADYKLVRYIGPRPHYEQLFDLKKDPLELKNLINDPEYAEVRLDLQKRLAHYRKTLPDKSPDFEEYINSYEFVGVGADFPDSEVDFSEVESIGQTFIAKTPHLRHVEWRWPFFITQYPQQGVEVTLRREGPEGEILGQRTVPPQEIYNLNRVRARFQADGLTEGETLYIEVRPQGSPSQRAIGMWKYKEDAFPEGFAYVDKQPKTGDFPMGFVFHKEGGEASN